MTTYMGPGLGSLVPVRCLSGMRVAPERPSSVRTNLAGRRRVYVNPRAARSWQCSIDYSQASEVATLIELESLGVPMVMVSDAASAVNVLAPGASLGPDGWVTSAASLSQGGPVALEDGVAGSSVQASMGAGGVAFSPLLPVVPGMVVTASVYARRSLTAASFRLDWMDLGTAQDGPARDSTASTVSTTAAPLPRHVITATVPDGVHVARLRLTHVGQWARPALSWTPGVVPWVPGEGAEAVHLSPVGLDWHRATADQHHVGASYTVTEVG